MLLISPVKVIAACTGLAAFSIATLAGLAADNPADVILSRAVAALFIGYVTGGIIGYLMDRTISESLDEYKAERPLPNDEQPAPPTETRAAA